MACIELDGRILIVDVGLSFPSADMPGIDLVLPDFDYVRERADRIEARRAHARTRGPHRRAAVPAPRARPTLPVYGTAFTLALLEGKLEEHGVADRCELHVVTPGEGATVGPFSMRFLRVTHSIPDGMAVAVDTPLGDDPAHRRLQDRPDAARRPADRPARPGRGGERPRRAPAALGLDERRGGRLHLERAERRPGASPDHREGARRWWWSPASPATSTGSSRSWTRPGRTSGWWRSSAGRCYRASAAARRLGLLHVDDRGHRRHRGGRRGSIPAAWS